MTDETLLNTVSALLRGSDVGNVRIVPAQFGGNNRIHLVEGASRPLVAKSYFSSASDERNRLQSEWAFINYAHGTGLRCVPEPVAADTDAQLALYSCIEGHKLASDEITEADVLSAADFIRALNETERRERGKNLPAASESGFCVSDHLAVNDSRMDRLVRAVEVDPSANGDAAEFVRELIAAWTDIKARVLAQAEAAGIGPDDVLASDQRWISPSDFGFHNALKRPDGTLCFLDFEYAGWDDMAKLASDFFLQPQVPVDPTYADAFLERAAGPRMSASLRARVHILQPVFALKWCVIMMNPFVLDRAQAGKFADPSRDEDERKRTQLTKAQRALQAIKQSEKNGIC